MKPLVVFVEEVHRDRESHSLRRRASSIDHGSAGMQHDGPLLTSIDAAVWEYQEQLALASVGCTQVAGAVGAELRRRLGAHGNMLTRQRTLVEAAQSANTYSARRMRYAAGAPAKWSLHGPRFWRWAMGRVCFQIE